MLWLLSLSAVAGPMPMFGRAPTPATPVVITAPTTTTTPQVLLPFPLVVPSSTVVAPAEPEEKREHAFPARLRRVEAAPVKTKVENPGRLTPIDELPSAFTPIEEAPNQLAVVTIRPVIRIEPPSTD